MFGQIGGLNAIGAPLPNNQIGGESFIRHIGSDKLIFDFHEGSGTTVRDKSHNNNNGTLGAGAAAPTWRRNSLYFNGGDYVILDSDNGLNFSGGYTIDMFVELDSFPQAIIYLLIKGDDANVDGLYALNISSEKPTFRVRETTVHSVASNAIKINSWHHIMGVWDTAKIMIYTNGIKGEESSLSVKSSLSSKMQLGWYKTAAPFAFSGEMKSARAYSKALSQIETQQNYLVNKFRGNN